MKNIPHFLSKQTHSTSIENPDDVMEPYHSLFTGWLIEMSLFMHWYRKSRLHAGGSIFDDEIFLGVIGIKLADAFDDMGNKLSNYERMHQMEEREFINILRERLKIIQQKDFPDNLPLFINVELLGRLLGLNDAEKAILVFATLINVSYVFRIAIAARCEPISTIADGPSD